MSIVPFEISLGLVTYNQYDFLKIFLTNYLKYGISKLPLIIIDDGSTDQTFPTLHELNGKNNITVHRTSHTSIAHARNQVLKLAITPWLAFSDTDCILDELYYELIMDIPKRFKTATAVEGTIKCVANSKPAFSHSLSNENGGMFATANMIFNVKQVIEIGSFDERFKNFREDADLALRVISQKGSIPFCRELVVYHPHIPRRLIPSVRNAWSRQKNILDSEILLYTKHPSRYGILRHFTSARSTILNWFVYYLLTNIRDIYKNFITANREVKSNLLGELKPILKNILVIFYEQICIYILCLAKMNQIRKLPSQ